MLSINITTHLNVDFLEKLHLHLVKLVLGSSDSFEVELGLLHLDDWVLHVGQADWKDDVFWSLGPDTAGGRNSDMEIKVKMTKLCWAKLHLLGCHVIRGQSWDIRRIKSPLSHCQCETCYDFSVTSLDYFWLLSSPPERQCPLTTCATLELSPAF